MKVEIEDTELQQLHDEIDFWRAKINAKLKVVQVISLEEWGDQPRQIQSIYYTSDGVIVRIV